MTRLKRKHRETFLLCPQCRSIEVYLVAGMITGQVYRCKDCGYQGSLILEVDAPPGSADPPA
ncbi:MAG: hypothetical protein ABSA15_01315 [Thermoplasmata archaeon]|jgi:predicted RNA-binding Zn-ribbon protein involved in translation (DUF1610 family)